VRQGWKDVIIPRPFPKGFCEDVLCVVWDRGSGVMIVQIAKDFGFRPGTLGNWMRVEAGK